MNFTEALNQIKPDHLVFPEYPPETKFLLIGIHNIPVVELKDGAQLYRFDTLPPSRGCQPGDIIPVTQKEFEERVRELYARFAPLKPFFTPGIQLTVSSIPEGAEPSMIMSTPALLVTHPDTGRFYRRSTLKFYDGVASSAIGSGFPSTATPISAEEFIEKLNQARLSATGTRD